MIKPLQNYLLVEIEARPEKIGSIYIPNLLNEKSQKATILAAGPGLYKDGKLKPCCANPGDRVLLIKQAGIEIGEWTLIRDDDILAVEI